MNIALIGAPGSGKSDLSKKVRVNLKGSTAVVDNYIQVIEKDTNLAIGQITDYIGNLYVALGRYAKERHARGYNDNVITCGTIIETAVYYAMHLTSINRVLSEEDKGEYAPRADAMLRMLACLYADVFAYDHLFYLPAVNGDDDVVYVDKQIQVAVAGFKLADIVTLPLENQAEKVMEIIG